MFRLILIAAVSALFIGTTARAGSDSFSVEDVVKFDILPGWRTSKGTHMAALRLRLAPGWKTYWRAPGEAGIPPRFDWSGSKNIGSVEFHWPTPNVYYQNGLRTVGYKDELILPIEMTPDQAGKPMAMRASVELGICEDICLPVSIRVSADLAGGAAPDAAIRAAMANAPTSARKAGMTAVTCGVAPISDGLRLTATINMPQLGRDEIAIFELSDQSIWISQADTTRSGPSLTATTELVPPSNTPFLLDRSDVRITVLAAGRAVEIMGCTG